MNFILQLQENDNDVALQESGKTGTIVSTVSASVCSVSLASVFACLG
ncbi:hypothetical protein HMPREF0043_02306 [Actinobaculum sp. oral taxon 183 str. F0552]|nr:hypothetical protein HMPREF0043_02306 [Actinobaculum sp. oral taxon 183 str. F0552]